MTVNDTDARAQAWSVLELTKPRDAKVLVAILALLCAVVLPVEAAPSKNNEPPVEPSIGRNVEVRVERGGLCRIDLKGVVFPGNQAEFQIATPPAHGTLTLAGRSMDTASYVYRHNGKVAGKDAFRFKLKTAPSKAWGYYWTRIEVEEPPSRLHVGSERLDFGEVFLGDTLGRTIAVANTGGGVLSGRLQTGAPWAVAGEQSEFSLKAGEVRRWVLEFKPSAPGDAMGVLEVRTSVDEISRVILSGTGRYKVEAPRQIDFPAEPGAADAVLPLKNLTGNPLALSLQVPAPLEWDREEVVLPPHGSGKVQLHVPACHYLEKRVAVEIGCDGVNRSVDVVLPPPPPLLEWEGGDVRDVGVRATGEKVALEVSLRNASPRQARVSLRLEGDGLVFTGSTPQELVIPATESRALGVEWKLPRHAGPARGAIVASSAGVEQKFVWNVVVEPAKPSEARPSKQDVPLPAPTGPADSAKKQSNYVRLTKQEVDAVSRFMPRDIQYRLEPAWGAATAIVSWKLSSGVSGEGAKIQRLTVQRQNLFASNPLDRRLQLPNELPPPVPKAEWVGIPPAEADVRVADDGTWDARVPGLGEGFHRIRLLIPEPGSKNFHGQEFVIEVGAIPNSSARGWGLAVAAFLLALYLWRKSSQRNS